MQSKHKVKLRKKRLNFHKNGKYFWITELLQLSQLKVSSLIIKKLFEEVSGWLGAKLNKEDQIKYKGLVTSTKLC